MRIIGLTGSIACGKSNISHTLSQLGACVIDGDLLSRELTTPGGPALPEIRRAFGDGVFLPDGTLDRRALGSIVFGDDAMRARLDGIMQPMLRELILLRIRQAGESGVPACVLDMPLLFEAELDGLCHSIWCAWLPRELQLQRLMQRDGFTRAEAERRIASQLSADEKAARSHVVIDTSGSIDYTKSKIPPLWAAELAQA